MLEPNKNDLKSVPNQTTSKPVEIDSTSDSSKSQVHLRKEELSVPFSANNINEISSYSAYASAESSPNQNSLLVNSESATHLRTKQQAYCSDSSPKSSSSSLDSYLTIENSSRVMQENNSKHNQDTTPTTESYFEVNKIFLDDEFQSLPCHFPDEVLKRQQAQEAAAAAVKFPTTKDSISSVISREIESQLHSFDSPDKTASSLPQTTTSPSQTKSLKTAIGSFFEKVLFGTGEKEQQKPSVEQTSPKPAEINKSKSAHFVHYSSSSSSNENSNTTNVAKLTTVNSIASASSPNPDCSPYKLLVNEMSSSVKISTDVVINDLNNRLSKPSSSEKAQSELNLSDKPINNLIESLASLNHKESDKIDPILSSASKKISAPSPLAVAASLTTENKSDQENKPSTVVVSSSSSSSDAKQSSQSSHVDHVPASSREFCMDLNFNLAAAAAATAAGPVVVVSAPDNRFTSNASTSSIHNDLKMILEECKDKTHRGIMDSPPHKKTSKSQSSSHQQIPQQQQQPKPQRTQAHRTKSASDAKKTSGSESASDSDNLNLIKAMMSMGNINKVTDSKHSLEQPTISWPFKENGRYKYSKEFLNQINEQRSEFIDQIYPDIFKAYCYCMNGKYWDPEKYFDIIQFPGEFEKIPNRNNNTSRNYNSNNNNNNNSYNNNSYSKNNSMNGNQQNSYPNRKRNNSTSNSKYDNYQKPKYHTDLLTTPSTSVLSSTNNIESPQPLQVPKNSPKIQHEHSQNLKNSLNLSHTNNSQKANKEKKKFNNLIQSLGVEQHHPSNNSNEADKILLGLIKHNEDKPASPTNFLDMLNNNKKESVKPAAKNANILDNLFAGRTSPQSQQQTKHPKHFPLVLTAQELEMSQMLTQQKLTKHKLPTNQSELSRYAEISADSYGNTSDAYKQLVKNLINHPLNSPSAVIGSQVQQQQQKPPASKQPQWPTQDNGTNVLRQLLNLEPEKLNESSSKPEKKPKKKPHHNHHPKAPKSPSTSKFPLENPHEKPFEGYFNDDKQHVESVVASTINNVLNKSPNNTTSKNSIENLFEKMNQQQQPSKKRINKNETENEHFNSLLNKMMNIIDESKQQPKPLSANESTGILRWFSGSATTLATANINTNNSNNNNTSAGSFSPTVLSEIEFMQMQCSKALNKLY